MALTITNYTNPKTVIIGSLIELSVTAVSSVGSSLSYEWKLYATTGSEFGSFIKTLTETSNSLKTIAYKELGYEVTITEDSTGLTATQKFRIASDYAGSFTLLCPDLSVDESVTETYSGYSGYIGIDDDACPLKKRDMFSSISGYVGSICYGCRGYCYGRGTSGFEDCEFIDDDGNYYSGYPLYQPEGYEDHSNHQGVKYKPDVAPDNYTPTPTSENKYIDGDRIFQNVQNTIRKLYEQAQSDIHLTQQTDDETDIDTLFEIYGLDKDILDDQETYRDLQNFEHENFSNFMFKEWLKQITNPIDQAMGCLHTIVNSDRIAFGTASEDLTAGDFVHISTGDEDPYTGRDTINVKKARAFMRDPGSYWSYDRVWGPGMWIYKWVYHPGSGFEDYNEWFANGFVVEDYEKNECVRIILRGVNKIMTVFPAEDGGEPTEVMPTYSIGQKVYLGDYLYDSSTHTNGFRTSMFDSDSSAAYTLADNHDVRRIVVQELGHWISQHEILFTFTPFHVLNIWRSEVR